MNRQFLQSIMEEYQYYLKAGTKSSYLLSIVKEEAKEGRKAIEAKLEQEYLQGKTIYLPVRVSIYSENGIEKIKHTGRGTRARERLMQGSFTRCEQSPYKLYKPFELHTSIWPVAGYRCLFYGTIGINLEEGGKPTDNGDLVLFWADDWQKVRVFLFKGMARPNNEAGLNEIVAFLLGNVIK